MRHKHRVVRAEGLVCPRCDGPVDFITPYYGRDEYDMDSDFVADWTWRIFIPLAEVVSAVRELTGNTRGAKEKLYHCSQCNFDLSYKEATKITT